jgi:hypothetical protein
MADVWIRYSTASSTSSYPWCVPAASAACYLTRRRAQAMYYTAKYSARAVLAGGPIRMNGTPSRGSDHEDVSLLPSHGPIGQGRAALTEDDDDPFPKPLRERSRSRAVLAVLFFGTALLVVAQIVVDLYYLIGLRENLLSN